VTHPAEIQRLLLDTSTGLAGKIGRNIGSYSSALLSVTGSGSKEILHRRGSGSLVSAGDDDYVLTANHVWKGFEKAAGLGLTLDKEDVDHKFFIPVSEIIPFGPREVPSWGPWGADMQLLRLPKKYALELKRVKNFYALTPEVPELPNIDSLEVSVLIGAPDEQGKREPQHATLTINAMFPTIRSRYTHDGLDYVDLELPIAFPGIPTEFSGMSGGGFWDVLLYGDESGEINWSLRLMGLACWQLEIVNGVRGVRCLGAKSIRSLLTALDSRL
jgi:hypothetical protein